MKPLPNTFHPGITECAKSNCKDGLMNGDEVDVDCSGSCTPCKVSSQVLALPAPSPRCPLSSLVFRLTTMAEGCAHTAVAGAAPDGVSVAGCSVECAAAFVPMYDDCAQVCRVYGAPQ